MLKSLREKRAALVAAMRAILDKAKAEQDRELSAEEATDYDGKEAEVVKLDAQIARASRLETHEAAGNAPQPAVAAGQRPIAGPQPRTEFESLGEFMHAVRFNTNDQRLASLWSEGNPNPAMQAEQRMDTGSAGGFMVPNQFRDALLKVEPGEAIIRPRATVIPAGSPPDAGISMPALDQSGSAPSNVFGGVTVDWIAEGGDKPETDADLREISLQPREVAGHIVVTDKLLRNWTAAGAFLETLLRQAVISAEELAFFSGNGVGKPLGIINSGAAKVVNRGTSSHIDYDDVRAMLGALLMRGGTPAWIGSQGVLPELMAMQDNSGGSPGGLGSYIWQPNARDAAGNQQLLGYPIHWHSRSPALGTKGDLVLADLRYYLIKDGSGPFVAASEHVHFTKNKTVIKIFWNVDGQPWLTEPFTDENSYESSPFVVLDVPA